MRADRMVASYRVSTARQEASGLDAQRQAVAAFLGGSAVVAEFTETESGKRTDRPELARAISACRLYGARLVIAKLDRLSRDAHFLLDLEKAGVDFVAADMPHANRFTVGIMALVAEEERRMISARTKAALAAARARETVLGGTGHTITAAASEDGRRSQTARASARTNDMIPVLAKLRAAGATSLSGIAAALNARGIPAARGEAWTATQVLTRG
ncbi:recombinase family protein [Methylobacterium sp.]|jgi:DNA invertase Pin-like site-specific DNA recombinase|uniref:recombinase family protein n=1 Tax=Methylobacterium sp. TaxID=409 RepID=UPI0004659613|nr:recombinase family protein [Methylobacterium sp.]RUP17422.1 MAG: recombinase family protein [Methylobacterium sp.]